MITTLLRLGALTFTPMSGEPVAEPITEPIVEPVGETPAETTEPTTETTSEEKDAWTYFTEFLSKFLEPQVVASIISVISQVGIVISLVASLKKLAQSKQTSLKDVEVAVMGEVRKVVSEEVANQVATGLDRVAKTCGNVNDILAIFSKILVLSQTPCKENSLAIIDLISKIGVVDKSVIDTQAKLVETTAKKEEEQKIATKEAVNKVIETTNTPDGTRI